MERVIAVLLNHSGSSPALVREALQAAVPNDPAAQIRLLARALEEDDVFDHADLAPSSRLTNIISDVDPDCRVFPWTLNVVAGYLERSVYLAYKCDPCACDYTVDEIVSTGGCPQIFEWLRQQEYPYMDKDDEAEANIICLASSAWRKWAIENGEWESTDEVYSAWKRVAESGGSPTDLPRPSTLSEWIEAYAAFGDTFEDYNLPAQLLK